MSRARDEIIAKILDCMNNPGQHGPEAERTCDDLKKRGVGAGTPRIVQRSRKDVTVVDDRGGQPANVQRGDPEETARKLPQAINALIDGAEQLARIAEQLQRPGVDLAEAIEAIATVRDNTLVAALSKLAALDELQKQANKALKAQDAIKAHRAFWGDKPPQTDAEYWGLKR